jgi:uncharacterized protein YdaU (DUF1376 family)
MSARWYKRCGADFIHGTMMLTLEEKGAYSLCLDLIYDRGGPIPDDARWLSGVCGVSIRKWNVIRDRLVLLGKLIAENDHLTNTRAGFELVSTEFRARERAESGAKGGRKRAENGVDTNKNNGIAQAQLKRQAKQIREEEIREEEEVEAAPQLRARPQPVAEAIAIWNDGARAAGWPLALKTNDSRQRNIGARLRENGLDGWRAAVTRGQLSPYLSQAPPPTWFTLDWLAGATNFLKVIEGNYDRNRSDDKPSGWQGAYVANMGGGTA